MMLRGFRTYKEFMECYEASEPKKTTWQKSAEAGAYGIITANQTHRTGGSDLLPTAKGIDLAPVPTENGHLWAGHTRRRNPAIKALVQAGCERTGEISGGI